MTALGFYDGTGGLSLLPATNFGSYRFGIWEAIDIEGNAISDLHEISFINNNGQDAVMSGIRVTYQCPADRLTFTQLTPADGTEFDPFDGFTLTFPEEVTVTDGTQFIVENDENVEIATLTATVNGTQVTLAPEEPIKTPGNYILKIDQKSFITEIGEFNKAFQVSFSVKDHPDTFNPTAFSIEAGKVKQLSTPIVLTFPGSIAALSEGTTTVDLIADGGTTALQGTLSVSELDDSQLLISFDESVSELRGQFTLTIPENTIKSTDDFHYNQAITLAYNCVGYDVPSDELVAKAQQLLTFTGVGYPKSQSDARLALAAVVNDENKTLQEYELAIIDFINTDDIVYPQYGKYYTFAKKDGNVYTFIGYADGAFDKATNADDAEHFLIMDVEGDRFVGMSDGTTARVLFNKAVYDDNPEEAFGLFSVAIEGFTDRIDGIGYKLEQVFSRDPKTTVTVTPADDARLDNISEIIITVNEAETIIYHSEKPIQMLLDGQVADVITSVSVKDNVVTVSTDIHKYGVYTLNIPKGALTFYSIDHDVDVPAISATYTLSREYAFRYDFFSHYILSNNVSTSGVHFAEEMNDLVVFTNKARTSLYVNPQACMTSVFDNNGNQLFSGTLVSGEEIFDGVTCSTLTFKFNTQFNKENLPDGRYFFVIEAGSFGDNNFGAYLENPSPELKSSCHLNDRCVYNYTIDHNAAGVGSVTVDNQQSIVFDLTGRRINGQAKSGLYIVGGKKVFVK